MVGPPGEQQPQQPGGRALADRDAAGDPDHVRHPLLLLAEERAGGGAQAVGRGDVEVEQPRQRQVDRSHLVEVDVVAEAADGVELLERQRQRRVRAQGRPVVAVELDVRRDLALCAHRRNPTGWRTLARSTCASSSVRVLASASARYGRVSEAHEDVVSDRLRFDRSREHACEWRMSAGDDEARGVGARGPQVG